MSEISSFHNDWLFWEESFTKNLEVTGLYTIDDRCWTFWLLCVVGACLFADQGPEFVNVHSRTVIFVHGLVKVEHTNFTEVTRMVLIHQCSVMMLTTSFTTTTGMFSVFTNTSMASTFVSSLLTVLPQSSSHCGVLISVTI